MATAETVVAHPVPALLRAARLLVVTLDRLLVPPLTALQQVARPPLSALAPVQLKVLRRLRLRAHLQARLRRTVTRLPQLVAPPQL